MTTKIVYGLIILTSAILAVANIALQAYLIAVLAIISGAIWLLLQVKTKEAPHSLFFVVFLGLTLLGSLRNLPIPFMLLALTLDLAAWDLSRFQTRINSEEQSASKTALELKHAQKLAITVSIGFVIALLPTYVHLSLNFVVFLLVLLLLMLILRKSILYLRKEVKISR
jgi:hypothetical protein